MPNYKYLSPSSNVFIVLQKVDRQYHHIQSQMLLTLLRGLTTSVIVLLERGKGLELLERGKRF